MGLVRPRGTTSSFLAILYSTIDYSLYFLNDHGILYQIKIIYIIIYYIIIYNIYIMIFENKPIIVLSEIHREHDEEFQE